MTDDRRAAWLLLLFTLGTVVIRWFAAGAIPLSDDEAWYWRWSLEPAFHYPDHPPMVAWLIGLGTLVGGHTNEGVRLFSLVLASMAGFIVFVTAADLGISSRGRLLCAMLFHLLPAPAAGALLMTPDVPLAFCWTAAIAVLVRLHRSHASLLWYAGALCVGLACLSKLSGWMLFPLLFAAVTTLPSRRARLRTVHPWLALMLAIAIALPWLIGELAHKPSSLFFQGDHLAGRLGGTQTRLFLFPARWLELLAGQAGLLTPPGAVWLAIALYRWKSLPAAALPVLLGAILPMAATLAAAVLTHPEQNWASTGHPQAAILMVLALTARGNVAGTTKAHAILLAGTALALTALIYVHAVHPFLPLPPERDPTARIRGWEQLAPLHRHVGAVDSVVCDNYGLASQLAWLVRHNEKQVGISSVDRSFHGPRGKRWLVLDQLGDYGQADISLRCRGVVHVPSLTLRDSHGLPLRTIVGFIADDCR